MTIAPQQPMANNTTQPIANMPVMTLLASSSSDDRGGDGVTFSLTGDHTPLCYGLTPGKHETPAWLIGWLAGLTP